MLGTDGKKVDWSNMPLPRMARGNALDAYFTMKCFDLLWPKIEKLQMEKTYEAILSPATNIFRDIELEGLVISNSILNDLRSKIYMDIVTTEEEIFSFSSVDKKYNIDSTADLTKIIYSCDSKNNLLNTGLGLYPVKRSDKTNKPSTDVESLDTLLDMLEQEINRRGINAQ